MDHFKSFYFIGFISPFEVGQINYALDYLEEYGFLIHDKPRDVFSIRNAFLLFQKFYHLKLTCQFNQETLDQMTILRCGNKDIKDIEGCDARAEKTSHETAEQNLEKM